MGLADFATVKSRDKRLFPGPGQYNPPSDFGKVRLEHITFKGRYGAASTSAREGVGSTNEEVGPGKYAVPQPDRGPQISMAPAHAHASSTKTFQTDIGPKYSPRQNQMSSDPKGPQYSFGVKHYFGSTGLATEVPGPEYDLPSTLSPRAVKLAGKTPRQRETGEDSRVRCPGPGAYDVPRFGDKVPKAKNIHLHKSQEAVPDLPGPGQYEVDQHTIESKTTPRGPGKRCTLSGRNFPPVPGPCGLPGPAAYDLSASDISRGKGKTMGAKPREVSELEAIYPKPGPGDYEIPSTFSGSKGFSFGAKPPEYQSRHHQPGPQDISVPQYSLAQQLASNAQGYRFEGRNKGFAKPEDSPRSWKLKKSDVPGPASYNPKYAGPNAPSYSLTARDHKGPSVVERENVPGPGTYDVKDSTHLAGFTFYKGSFAEKGAETDPPGPGAYDHLNAFNSVHSARGAEFSLHGPPPLPGSLRRIPHPPRQE